MTATRVVDPFEVLRQVRARRALANSSHSSEDSGKSYSSNNSNAYGISSRSSHSSRPSPENTLSDSQPGLKPAPARAARVRGIGEGSLKEGKINNNNINNLQYKSPNGEVSPDTPPARVARAARVTEIPLDSKGLASPPPWLEFGKSGESYQAADLLVWFDERAAILEYDSGWSQAEAEALAAAEIDADENFASASPTVGQVKADDLITLEITAPVGSPLQVWHSGVLSLSQFTVPCPGFQPRRWQGVYDRMCAFLMDYGEEAARAGWTDLDLFGVHPTTGAVRIDYCGALILCGASQVVEVQRDVLRYSNGLIYYRSVPVPYAVPVWLYGLTREAVQC